MIHAGVSLLRQGVTVVARSRDEARSADGSAHRIVRRKDIADVEGKRSPEERPADASKRCHTVTPCLEVRDCHAAQAMILPIGAGSAPGHLLKRHGGSRRLNAAHPEHL